MSNDPPDGKPKIHYNWGSMGMREYKHPDWDDDLHMWRQNLSPDFPTTLDALANNPPPKLLHLRILYQTGQLEP